MNKTILIFLLVSSFLLNGCISNLEEYDYEYQGDKLVVYGLLNDTGILVLVRKTVSPLRSFDSDTILGAVVEVYENDQLISKLTESEPGYFKSNVGFKPDYSASYYLKIKVTGLPEAITEAQHLPKNIKIDTAYFNNFNLFLNGIDDANELNFYSAKTIKLKKGQIIKTEPKEMASATFYDILSDTKFNGKQFSYNTEFQISTHDSIQTLIIDFCSLSPHFAEFLNTLDEYESTRDNILYDRPTQIFNNIHGGYGIFGAYRIHRFIKTYNFEN